MTDLEDLEMSDLEAMDGYSFESTDMEGGEFETYMEGGSDFEDYEDFEDFEDFESWESVYEDLEADPFLGKMFKNVSKSISRATGGIVSPAVLQNLAGQAARLAGGAIAGPAGANIAGQIATRVLREGDSESDYLSDLESDYESGPLDPEVLDELHYYAYQAAEAGSEFEADPFIGSLVGPLVSGLLSGESDLLYEDLFEDGEGGFDPERDEFLPALIPLAAPLIAKGVGAIGKALIKNKKTRPLARVLPKILKDSAKEVQQLRRPATRRDVARIVGKQSARTLGSPRAVSRAVKQNRVAAARAQARPMAMRRPAMGASRSMSRSGKSRPTRATYGMPSYGYVSGGPGGRRQRGKVVGYVLKPIYGRSRR